MKSLYFIFPPQQETHDIIYADNPLDALVEFRQVIGDNLPIDIGITILPHCVTEAAASKEDAFVLKSVSIAQFEKEPTLRKEALKFECAFCFSEER
jgi:hypothetical protein